MEDDEEKQIVHHDVDSIANSFILNSEIMGKKGEEELKRLKKTRAPLPSAYPPMYIYLSIKI